MNRIPKSWYISCLKKSYKVLGMTIGDVTQEQAQQIKDGPDGWSVLEIMCHVRDFQEIFMQRVTRMLDEDEPELVPVDEAAREKMVIDKEYAKQNLRETYLDYVDTRHRFVELINVLEDGQLDRRGRHPMTGEVDVTTEIFHTILHDADHTEQIARILGATAPGGA